MDDHVDSMDASLSTLSVKVLTIFVIRHDHTQMSGDMQFAESDQIRKKDPPAKMRFLAFFSDTHEDNISEVHRPNQPLWGILYHRQVPYIRPPGIPCREIQSGVLEFQESDFQSDLSFYMDVGEFI